MGTTTFTGPIKAGDVLDTTGTTPGTIRNVGYAVMGQSASVTQAATSSATATAICIPANSHIIGIQVLATEAWSGGATISVGTSSSADELVAATAIGTAGLFILTPGTSATRTAKWSNIGTSDAIIYVLSSATGTGVADVVVRYLQAENA